MRSPFPGMDLYLEDPGGWNGVHGRLIAVLGELLNRDLGPDFIADGDTRVYVVSPAEQRWVFPDLYIIEAPRVEARVATRGRIVAPVHVSVAEPLEIQQPYILIRDRASRRVVTILELLSPINKVPRGITGAVLPARDEFLRKRRDTMASTTHWVEIDLLRAGERPPEVQGVGPYYAALKRGGAADLEVWPIGLRDPLPTIAVPLTPPHDDVALDLRVAFDLLVARFRYAELIDYAASPPPPPLALDDALWVRDQVRRWDAARAGAAPGANAGPNGG